MGLVAGFFRLTPSIVYIYIARVCYGVVIFFRTLKYIIKTQMKLIFTKALVLDS